MTEFKPAFTNPKTQKRVSAKFQCRNKECPAKAVNGTTALAAGTGAQLILRGTAAQINAYVSRAGSLTFTGTGNATLTIAVSTIGGAGEPARISTAQSAITRISAPTSAATLALSVPGSLKVEPGSATATPLSLLPATGRDAVEGSGTLTLTVSVASVVDGATTTRVGSLSLVNDDATTNADGVLIGGSATALALTAPMVAALFEKLTGVPQSFMVEATVILICVLIFAASSFVGLEKGFKRMSDANTWIALGLLGFVVAVGPTLFILQMGTNSLGLMLQEFVRMVTWTDPVERKGFVESWTVFYWAWWVAYGPFVALFATRISRGRTLRELIFGLITFGTLGAGIFYIVLGNYAMNLELTGALEVTRLVKEESGAAALAEVLATLPYPTLVILGFLVVAAILMATTYDSASYTLASVSSRDIHAGQDPARWNRVFWAFAIGVPPVALLFVKGGITVVQSATIIVSLPLLAVGVLLALSILRMIREDEAAGKL
ncbi:MAG: hypothetical protein EBS39_02670 [Gammaproteobacteria bacterium]|nr:hypothetical protein [Gammaproteobacteria bacterium]